MRTKGERLDRAAVSDRKRFAHPQLGPLELDCDVLTVPGDDQVLIVYSAAPGSPEAEALALLRVLGTEPLTATLPRKQPRPGRRPLDLYRSWLRARQQGGRYGQGVTALCFDRKESIPSSLTAKDLSKTWRR